MVTKHPSADLRAGYRKTFEIALALALGKEDGDLGF